LHASHVVSLLFNGIQSPVNASHRQTATHCSQICDRSHPECRHQPHRRAAPQPVSRFLTFTKTAGSEGWECGAPRGWRVADTAAAAATIAHTFGEFSVMAESAEAAELSALAWWVSIHGTGEWLAGGRRAILLT
jgi:hypothetical protein